MLDAKTFAGQLIQQLLYGVAFVKLFVPRPARVSVAVFGFFGRRRLGFFLSGEAEIQVRILFRKPGQVFRRMKVMNRLVVAFPHLYEVLGELLCVTMTMFQVSSEVGAFAFESIGVLIKRLEQLENFAQLFWRKLLLILQISQADFFGSQLNEDAIELRVVIDILNPLLAGNLVERWLSDVNKAPPYQFGHLPIEKRQQERADMGTIDVGISHDDDL